METLSLQTVLNAEREALAVGASSAEDLKMAAEKWRLERQVKLLTFESGVAEVIERITNLPQ